MTADRRYLNLNAYLRNSGYHEAAWRVSPADPASVLDPRHYIDLAKTAERGVLDSIFLPDSPGVAEFRSQYLPGADFDPLQLLSSVAAVTEQVGLIATVSTTYSFPWDVARRLVTLDFLSHGRAGWNIVTTAEPAAANFGDQPHPATFRAVAQKLSALPGGLDFTGTPEGMAQLITDWWDVGAADGFTIMPNVLPDQLAAFVDHAVPILQRRGIADRVRREDPSRAHRPPPASKIDGAVPARR